MRKKRWRLLLLESIASLVAFYFFFRKVNLNQSHQPGDRLDSFNGVLVYYNGAVDHTDGRNVSGDGYNIGLKYQCVEFVKRYYYEKLHHKMPDSYGHAVDFYDLELKDGEWNSMRALMQYSNHGNHKPEPEDIIVFDKYILNRFGHVAIISEVHKDQIQIVQQNPGQFGDSRETIGLIKENSKWVVDHPRALGWLRKE